MTEEAELRQIMDVTRVLYDREYAKVAEILAREGAILRDLAKLDQLGVTAGSASDDNSTMHVMGKDILWQAWQQRARHQLNMELAQVRAQKLSLMGQVRKAFGRDQAIRNLAEQKASDRKQAEQEQARMRLLGLA